MLDYKKFKNAIIENNLEHKISELTETEIISYPYEMRKEGNITTIYKNSRNKQAKIFSSFSLERGYEQMLKLIKG